METNKMNIYQKMSAITDEIARVAKNLNVNFGKSSYKAVGEADVLAAVKPIENKYGVYSFPAKRNIIMSQMVTTTDKEGNEKTSPFLRIETIYRFVNIDTPADFLEVTVYGDGVDPQDKAPGKAMTYADKYALLKAYKIETGDDPDQTGSQDLKPVRPSYTPSTTEMTLEKALSKTTSKGKLYSALSPDELKFIINSDKAAPDSKKAAKLVLDDMDMQPIIEEGDSPF